MVEVAIKIQGNLTSTQQIVYIWEVWSLPDDLEQELGTSSSNI